MPKKGYKQTKEHKENHKTTLARPEVKEKMCNKVGNKNGNYKHGLKKHLHYNRWKNMIARCYNPNTINYHNYGGRGITVCETWRKDPIAFCEWADQHYNSGLQLDRKDNNGLYSPENCRFTTPKENNKNKRPMSEEARKRAWNTRRKIKR